MKQTLEVSRKGLLCWPLDQCMERKMHFYSSESTKDVSKMVLCLRPVSVESVFGDTWQMLYFHLISKNSFFKETADLFSKCKPISNSSLHPLFHSLFTSTLWFHELLLFILWKELSFSRAFIPNETNWPNALFFMGDSRLWGVPDSFKPSQDYLGKHRDGRKAEVPLNLVCISTAWVLQREK